MLHGACDKLSGNTASASSEGGISNLAYFLNRWPKTVGPAFRPPAAKGCSKRLLALDSRRIRLLGWRLPD